MARVLIVEDESRISSFIAKGLRAEGYTPVEVAQGARGLDHVLAGEADLVILDIGLQDMSGLDVLHQLRAQGSRVPVIVLTARDSVCDTVAALDGGADDYMSKPFRFAELLARVRVRLRQATVSSAPAEDTVRSGDVLLNLRTRRLWVDGADVELSAREFALTEMFVRNPGTVLSREQLLDHVWGYDFEPGSNVVDVYVGYLRRKLGAGRIVTVRGVGYRFEPGSAPAADLTGA